MSALEEYLTDTPELDDDFGPVEAPETLESADWQMRRLVRLRRLMAQNQAIAHSEIQRIRDWLDTENAKLGQRADWIEQSLELFHRALLDADPTRKTISLPAGQLKARKHPDRIDVINPATFAAWAAANRPELIRTKVEADKTEIKRLLATGEPAGDYGVELIDPTVGQQVPGVVLVPGEVSFTVETPHLGEVDR